MVDEEWSHLCSIPLIIIKVDLFEMVDESDIKLGKADGKIGRIFLDVDRIKLYSTQLDKLKKEKFTKKESFFSYLNDKR